MGGVAALPAGIALWLAQPAVSQASAESEAIAESEASRFMAVVLMRSEERAHTTA